MRPLTELGKAQFKYLAEAPAATMQGCSHHGDIMNDATYDIYCQVGAQQVL